MFRRAKIRDNAIVLVHRFDFGLCTYKINKIMTHTIFVNYFNFLKEHRPSEGYAFARVFTVYLVYDISDSFVPHVIILCHYVINLNGNCVSRKRIGQSLNLDLIIQFQKPTQGGTGLNVRRNNTVVYVVRVQWEFK